MNREDAWKLLCEYTKSEGLRRHALAVEACMRVYARKFGEDEKKWAIAGLLHDFDYEVFPNAPDHPLKGSQILCDLGYPEDVRRAILGHADYTGVPRDSLMAKSLFACDELAGFITACSLVRPDRIQSLEPRSVRKRMKDKAFAKAVRREDIILGAEALGVDTNEHIDLCIRAMQGIADQLGLKPVATSPS
jgi:putative nucleotidyltransferase with HDIG domain